MIIVVSMGGSKGITQLQKNHKEVIAYLNNTYTVLMNTYRLCKAHLYMLEEYTSNVIEKFNFDAFLPHFFLQALQYPGTIRNSIGH